MLLFRGMGGGGGFPGGDPMDIFSKFFGGGKPGTGGEKVFFQFAEGGDMFNMGGDDDEVRCARLVAGIMSIV